MAWVSPFFVNFRQFLVCFERGPSAHLHVRDSFLYNCRGLLTKEDRPEPALQVEDRSLWQGGVARQVLHQPKVPAADVLAMFVHSSRSRYAVVLMISTNLPTPWPSSVVLEPHSHVVEPLSLIGGFEQAVHPDPPRRIISSATSPARQLAVL